MWTVVAISKSHFTQCNSLHTLKKKKKKSKYNIFFCSVDSQQYTEVETENRFVSNDFSQWLFLFQKKSINNK